MRILQVNSAKHNVCAGGTVCVNLFCGFTYNQIQIQLPVGAEAQNYFTERFNFRANQWGFRWTIQQFNIINFKGWEIIKKVFDKLTIEKQEGLISRKHFDEVGLFVENHVILWYTGGD